MDVSKVSRSVVVINRNGLHARPAEIIAIEAGRFQATVAIVKQRLRIDAKSVLEILALGATEGTPLIVEADGPDAEAAVEAIVALVGQDFTEFEPQDIPPLPRGQQDVTKQERA